MSTNIVSELCLSKSDIIHKVIGNTFIVEYGIIKEIKTSGIVTVEMSVASSAKNIIITDCVLASLSSVSVSFNLEPNVDDKVLVLFPKNYSSQMFTKDNNEPIITECASGYSMLGGIAILLNQYNEDEQKNTVNFNNGELTVKLAYSEDNEDNLITFTTTNEGEVNLVANNNVINLNNGELTLKLAYSEDKGKNLVTFTTKNSGAVNLVTNNTTVAISESDVITLDNGKATVTIDASGNVKVETSGKYSFKNKTTDLKDVIDGLAQQLENLVTVGSPATQTTSPATKTAITTWRTGKLSTLLN